MVQRPRTLLPILLGIVSIGVLAFVLWPTPDPTPQSPWDIAALEQADDRLRNYEFTEIDVREDGSLLVVVEFIGVLEQPSESIPWDHLARDLATYIRDLQPVGLPIEISLEYQGQEVGWTLLIPGFSGRSDRDPEVLTTGPPL